MSIDFSTIAARALNCAWATHRPTYAGLRLLLQSIGDDNDLGYDFIRRRAKTRASWRFFSFPITKDASISGDVGYRNSSIGSPLTLLTESYILAEMSRHFAFSCPSQAYSYRWPASPTGGRNFEYYFTGYAERHSKVTELLTQAPNAVALIVDIKKYYPSVDLDQLERRVSKRITSINEAESRKAIETYLTSYLSHSKRKPQSGLPTGPDTSHALAHVVLEDFDHEMTSKHGERYLRYVDDIIVVCDPIAKDEVLQNIKSLLAKESLELNDSKTDTVTSAEWLVTPSVSSDKDDPMSFERLTADIIRFFIQHPDDVDSIQGRFRSNGFSLPMARLGALSKSVRYHSYLGLRSLLRWFLELFHSTSKTPEELLSHAFSLRDNYQRQYNELTQTTFPVASMHRRWAVQRWRRVLSRLLYLVNPSSYPLILKGMPRIDELADIIAVMTDVWAGQVSNVLRYPGRPTTTFIHLWQASQDSTPIIRLPSAPNRATASALADLSISLGISDADDVSGAISPHYPGTSLLLAICGGKPTAVSPTPQSYLDELQLLLKGADPKTVSGLFRSRHDEREEVDLDVLGLFGDHSPHLGFAPRYH